jgi:hypothetical protein
MAQNRVQYQKGLSMPEFFDRFGSVHQCEQLVRGWRWSNGFVCPLCEQTWHSEFRLHYRLYFQCSTCRYQCSLVSGTIFESSKLPLPRWFLAMHLITQAKNNVSAMELKHHLGVFLAWSVHATSRRKPLLPRETRQNGTADEHCKRADPANHLPVGASTLSEEDCCQPADSE